MSLIPSERHTRADLELWAELEEADRIHGERLLRSGKAERSLETIHEFLDSGNAYGSSSWGKDSVVLAHLLWVAGQARGRSVPLVWVTIGESDSLCWPVRDAFLAAHPGTDYHEILVPFDGTFSEKARHLKGAGFGRAVEMFGERYITGIRADESGVRRIRFRAHGDHTDRTCWPLARWTVADIYGFLAVMDLPVHPVYAMLGGGRWPREHLRVASAAGWRGEQFGRCEWEKEYVPDVFRRLRSPRH